MPEADEQVEYDPVKNPDNLTLVTGISKEHLSKMLKGELAPSHEHYERIQRSVGKEIADDLNTHISQEPEYITSRVGRVPDGYFLIRRVSVCDLRLGDYISYDIGKSSGSAWIEVRSIDKPESLSEDGHEPHFSETITFDLGGVVQKLSAVHAVRIARIRGKEND